MGTSSFPQILTRSTVPLLSEGLDAGDILECYALVRKASLHNAMMPGATLTIHKVAIGLRYRPLTVNDPADEEKMREITLEYGPQRMGVDLDQESMPSVQHEHAAGGGPDIIDLNTTTSKSFVTWENEGKVYYTTQIASTGYLSAYYMASVTGAVLGKILEKAVDYPMENAYIRGRPRRYQPFVVLDGSAGGLIPPGFQGVPTAKRKVLLRSSSSTDFMEYMWYTLAELGVNLHPILAPPTYEIQLLAASVEKVKVGPPTWVTKSAAQFYQRLYQCIDAKVTGDYSRYSKPPTPSPTTAIPAPSEAPSPPSSSPSMDNNHTETDNNNDGQRSLRADKDFPGTPEIMQTEPPIDALQSIEDLIYDGDNASTAMDTNEMSPVSIPSINQTTLTNDMANWYANQSLPQSIAPTNGTTIDMSSTPVSSSPSSQPTNDSPSESPSMAPSVFKMNKQDTKSEVDQAQEAADQAKQAAAEAKDAAKTDVDTKAADAAQVAAQAAQKAADATSTAAAQAAMEALLSGDGSTMVSVVAPCFADPQFGIAVKDENGTLTSQAYLYLDGSSYYRLNLTYPFVQVVPVEHTLPQPRDFAETLSGGDIVDWTLALMLLFLLVFGILMLIQQVLGGYIKFIEPLFRFQIWFFHPRHFEDIKDSIEEERRLTASQGQGPGYKIGQDVIPASMGGRRTSPLAAPVRQLLRCIDHKEEESFFERIPLNGSGEHQQDSEEMQEIEMTEPIAIPNSRFFDETYRASSRGSLDGGDSDASTHYRDNVNAIGDIGNSELPQKDHRIKEKDLPSRFTRDPNYVDMPNLKSSSKVAVPVGGKRNHSFGSTSDDAP